MKNHEMFLIKTNLKIITITILSTGRSIGLLIYEIRVTVSLSIGSSSFLCSSFIRTATSTPLKLEIQKLTTTAKITLTDNCY